MAAKLVGLLKVSYATIKATQNLPLAPLESIALTFTSLFVVTYLFWWIKPKDIKTPWVVRLPKMTVEQRVELDSMFVSDAFDLDSKPYQESYHLPGQQTWYHTPHAFEKENRDKTI